MFVRGEITAHTNCCNGAEVTNVAKLNGQESRERHCDVDESQEEDTVDTNLDTRAHVELVENKEWQSKN